jgi:dihydrofolate reductase
MLGVILSYIYMKHFSIILAVDNENWIGAANDLAWNIPEDRKYFRDVTSTTQDPSKQNAVIMWRKTWESIPEKYRPFSKRQNYILSRGYSDGNTNSQWAYEYSDIDLCLKAIAKRKDIENIFIIWWAQIYNQVLEHPGLDKAYITRIYHKYHCDTFFHGLPLGFDLLSRSEMKQHEGIEFEFSVYIRKISLISKIKNIFNK